jgi:Tfp pilus assembly protein PilX
MIALIILVALTIGGIALVRSVDTSNLISGNLAFQQSTTRSGEAGTEDAIQSVIEASTLLALEADDFTKAYAASTPASGAPGNPASAADWAQQWGSTFANRVHTLPTDAAGNTASYTIQRLCLGAGDPGLQSTGCSSYSQTSSLTGQDQSSGSAVLARPTQYLYRITTRVAGPRNTVSFIQTIVAK